MLGNTIIFQIVYFSLNVYSTVVVYYIIQEHYYAVLLKMTRIDEYATATPLSSLTITVLDYSEW